MKRSLKNTTVDDSLILYAELNNAEIRAAQRHLKTGRFKRIVSGVLIANPEEEWPAIIAFQLHRVLKKMTVPVVASIAIDRVSGKKLPHECRESRLTAFEQDIRMIAHQRQFMHRSVLYISQKLEKSNRNHSSSNFHQSMKSWRIDFRPNIS
jgi:hypothetical protein